MPSHSRQISSDLAEAAVSTAYDEAGYRYGKYADGNARNLFQFEGRHAYGDRKIWGVIESRMLALRARGLRRLRVLDIGCGPGTWLRRVVVRAKQLGFTEVVAHGFDIADAQLHRARALSRGVAELDGVRLTFAYGDVRGKIAAPEGMCDLCLCLCGVLNHIPVAELPEVFARIGNITAAYFIATVRSVGSTPTVYVDDLGSAVRFYQDNRINRLDVEFANGRRCRFGSHLFSRAELARLAEPIFETEDIFGLDLFHGRFASDPRWNPPAGAMTARLTQELDRLEDRYCRDPGFVNHATHLLIAARNPKAVRHE
jgi:SAM-dependent methyltransferase